ncbi:hypothetical protein [Gluconobacter oxydans]|uniref:hypothetical protein n=1 Tax=Gluconobacter oxydans TaxID=442 RepID=UPI00062C79E2|nr:hypothetical protein [Gluconobacter oxydans]
MEGRTSWEEGYDWAHGRGEHSVQNDRRKVAEALGFGSSGRDFDQFMDGAETAINEQYSGDPA